MPAIDWICLYLFIGVIFARSYARYAIKERTAQDGAFYIAVGCMWLLWPLVTIVGITAIFGAAAVKSLGKVSE